MTQTTAYPHVTNDPGVAEGQPCIGDTGISVAELATAHEEGRSAVILQEYFRARLPRPLTLGEVHSALAYFYDHHEVLAAVADASRRRVDNEARERREAIIRRYTGR